MRIVLIDNDINRMNTIASELTNIGIQNIFRVNATGSAVNLPQDIDLLIVLISDMSDDIAEQLSVIKADTVISIKKNIDKFQWNESAVLAVADNKSVNEQVKHIINICHGLHYRYLLYLGSDTSTKEGLAKLEKYAMSSVPVLISGETGTGKEIAAKYIHYTSSFKDGDFVAVNCAAIPETMFEAILFGHEKGAFTNAIQTYIGKIEQANNGTLLLDEISELPMPMQAKLLRVIQEKEIEKIGSNETIKLNFRLIATTNKDLKELVNSGLFRSDLFYRLNVAMYEPVPLRKKQEDINDIADYLLAYHGAQYEKNGLIFSDKAMKALKAYEWPGNIRELENIIQKAIILDQDSVIDVNDIEIEMDRNDDAKLDGMSPLQETEALKILDVLKEAAGRRDLAAKILNISTRTLRYKISKLREFGYQVP